MVAHAGADAPSRPTVLVVDDEAGVRQMVAIALRRHGFDPVLSADGQEALELLENGLHVDVVLADLRMPRLDGRALVERLRRDSRWSALPVVSMSAFQDERQEREIRAAGADAFLPKPFTIDALTQALTGLLPGARAASA